MSVWFITGASRGFGLEIAREALDRGHRVVATARCSEGIGDLLPDAGDRLLALDLDVTDQAQAHRVVDAAVERFGRIDVVVNNAGRGLLGAVEEVSDPAVRAAFDVNVFGALNIQRAVLPHLRVQRHGHIVNISSVAGVVGIPGWGLYNATKFAMEGFSEATSQELAPLGIKVTLIEPGYFRTDFLDDSSLDTESTIIDDYADTAGATRTHARGVNHAQPGDPVKGAKAIVDITEVVEPPLRLILGSDAYGFTQAKLDTQISELRTWRKVSESTDHDDQAPAGRP
ncbi:SDR family NAD(P)-dependent oxidoreductase [Nocardia yamanashiensis]|uniref:oxidoreductase n=1 Tax=Nocardia yamanashiensis TaxID=209247 RepID=UPI001E5DA157|nr:oxidoreductase [Nocardia yamanashiensis]UGT44132.1 SDR family NAD(P)-dependent oxidoreductase [Nocardia yamanashiensis]